MPRIDLTEFDPSHHLPLLHRWLARSHVVPWWGDPELVLREIRQLPADQGALITVDGRAVGYLCWQLPPPDELARAGLDDLPDDLVDIDLMIGEPDALGRGIGPTALKQLLDRLRADGVSAVGLAAATDNRRALTAYEKAGFLPFRDFVEDGRQMRYFVRHLLGSG